MKCEECGSEIENKKDGRGRPREYCESCRVERRQGYMREYMSEKSLERISLDFDRTKEGAIIVSFRFYNWDSVFVPVVHADSLEESVSYLREKYLRYNPKNKNQERLQDLVEYRIIPELREKYQNI